MGIGLWQQRIIVITLMVCTVAWISVPVLAAEASSETAAMPDVANRVALPEDPSVLNVRRDFGAKGDGIADDTDALQKGLDASCGINSRQTKVLFLPHGTYRVTRTLVVKNALGPWLYGESRDGVIIRLADGARDCNSVLRTHPNEKGPTSADWFMRNIRNLTIDVGNNPDTDGIRYYATNSGILQNVRVIGRGKIAINAGFLDQSGPNLVQDALIDGDFETGILSQWIWGQTLSRVTIRNCRKAGVVVCANAVGIEDLTVENTPLALDIQMPNNWGHWSGVVALVGGRFTAANADDPSIRNQGVLYARNIKTQGFAQAIQSTSPAGNLPGPDIDEYASHGVKRLFDSPAKSLNLPIQREPAFPWETDPTKWLCANEHGAIPGDNRDDTAAIQKAIDTAAAQGKTTVYLRGSGGGDPNWYTVDGEVRVHGSVRHILGLGFGRILGGRAGKFVISDDSAPVVKFQNIDSFGGPPVTLENRSASRTLVVESSGVKILGTGTGDIFATDCPSTVELRCPGQKMWARQLNPEGNSDTGLVRNEGAHLWVLGVKHEGPGVRFATTKGGRTEILGLFNYGPGIKEGDNRPMFDIDNASFSAAGVREITFGTHNWFVKVRERRGADTRTLGSDREGGWIGWSLYSGQE